MEETDSPRQPDWASIGVTLSRDVGCFEQAKLRMLNAAHSTLAYIGCLIGLETVGKAITQPELRIFLEALLSQDIEPTLTGRSPDELAAYRRSIRQRFENPAIRHLLDQIACDGSQKLPVRVFPTASETLHRGALVARLAVPIAAWMHFIRSRSLSGKPIVDPLQNELTGWALSCSGEVAHDLPPLLALPHLFPERFVRDQRFTSALGEAYQRIERDGPVAAMRMAGGAAGSSPP
ncbi:MAG: hypothetical protein ACREFT_02285 [Acetobacteraceae bacterium]